MLELYSTNTETETFLGLLKGIFAQFREIQYIGNLK